MYKTLCLYLLASFSIMQAQDRAFKLYDKNGNEINFEQVLDQSSDADVILFGEFHDQPISHWLQSELLRALHAQKGERVIVGAEMFETDNQIIIDEYLLDIITTKKFEAEARLWNNYKTDYKPIVEYCKANDIKFYGTNAPGRYVNALYNNGFEVFDKLSELALSYLCPMPLEIDYDLPTYAQLQGMGSAHGQEKKYFVEAQALRDATMAHTILQTYEKESVYLHLNGSYHSDHFEGIGYYLSVGNPDLKVKVLTTVYQDEIDQLDDENHGKADVIICIPQSMTRSY